MVVVVPGGCDVLDRDGLGVLGDGVDLHDQGSQEDSFAPCDCGGETGVGGVGDNESGSRVSSEAFHGDG